MITACSCPEVTPIARNAARSRLRCTSPSTNTFSTLRPAAAITTYPANVNGCKKRVIPLVATERHCSLSYTHNPAPRSRKSLRWAVASAEDG